MLLIFTRYFPFYNKTNLFSSLKEIISGKYSHDPIPIKKGNKVSVKTVFIPSYQDNLYRKDCLPAYYLFFHYKNLGYGSTPVGFCRHIYNHLVQVLFFSNNILTT